MRKTAKIISLLVALCLVLPGFSDAAQAAGEIGIVDNMRVMDEYPAAQAAQKKVISLRQELESKFNRLKEQLGKDMDTAANEEAKLKLQNEARSKFEAEKARFESLVQGVKQDIDTSIENAINKVAQQKGLSVVMSNTVVYYGGVDITNDVLAALK